MRHAGLMKNMEKPIKTQCHHCQSLQLIPYYKQGLWTECSRCRHRIAIPVRSRFMQELELKPVHEKQSPDYRHLP